MYSFLQVLSDPNVAYLLLTLGVIGLLAEFFHPGAILPGIAGAIALIMGFVGLGQLPFSWGGLASINANAFLLVLREISLLYLSDIPRFIEMQQLLDPLDHKLEQPSLPPSIKSHGQGGTADDIADPPQPQELDKVA